MLAATAICALLTLPVAWNARRWVSGDGLSYIEMADRAAKLGPWPLLSNAYWSPAYPAILAIALRVLHPSETRELIVVRGVDWIVCVFTYLTFTSFLFNLLRWIHISYDDTFASGARVSAFLAFAYSLVFVSNLEVSLWLTGPHILLEGMVYLAAAFCLRLSLPATRLSHYAALGVVLALAYVTKAALFPLSLVLLAILFVAPNSREKGRAGAVIATCAFLLFSAPLVWTLSYSKGRLTFGDAGRLNYARFVNDLPYYEHGLVPTAVPTLKHPPETVLTSPLILKFAGPFQATWPLWYDPSYWYDGIPARFNVRQQVRALLGSLGINKRPSTDSLLNLAERYGPVLAGLAALAILGLSWRRAYSVFKGQSWLFLWPAWALFTFASVLMHYRYVNSFIVLGLTGLFLAAVMASKPDRAAGVALTVAAALLFTAGPEYARQATLTNGGGIDYAKAAKTLRDLGIRQGDQLASTEFPYTSGYLVRLSGAHFGQLIVAEPWLLSKLPAPDVRRVLDALRTNGAKALMSYNTPAFENDAGWFRVTGTIYIRLLD